MTRFASRKRAGFTIMDLVISVSITGVLATMAVPPLLSLRKSSAVQAEVDRFAAHHSFARQAALRFARTAELHLDTVNARVWVEMDTTIYRTGVRDTIGPVVDFSGEGIDLAADRTVLCYDSRGIPTVEEGCDPLEPEIVFRGAEHADTVRVTALGQLRTP